MLDRTFLVKVGRATAVVTEMAVTVVLGVFLGSYLDDRFALSPVLLLTFSLGALTVGMVRLTRSVGKLTASDDDHPPKHDAQRDRPVGGGDAGGSVGRGP